MTGRHEAPPLGSGARDATAPPYHGRHRYVDDGSKGINLPPDQQRWTGTGFTISQSTIDEIERVSNEWPDGIHTCAELQVLEPGRRMCSCGRCERVGRVADERWSDPEDTHQGGWARCDRCHLPAVKTPDGRWVHAEAADAAFCGFVFADTYDRPFDD